MTTDERYEVQVAASVARSERAHRRQARAEAKALERAAKQQEYERACADLRHAREVVTARLDELNDLQQAAQSGSTPARTWSGRPRARHEPIDRRRSL